MLDENYKKIYKLLIENNLLAPQNNNNLHSKLDDAYLNFIKLLELEYESINNKFKYIKFGTYPSHMYVNNNELIQELEENQNELNTYWKEYYNFYLYFKDKVSYDESEVTNQINKLLNYICFEYGTSIDSEFDCLFSSNSDTSMDYLPHLSLLDDNIFKLIYNKGYINFEYLEYLYNHIFYIYDKNIYYLFFHINGKTEIYEINHVEIEGNNYEEYVNEYNYLGIFENDLKELIWKYSEKLIINKLMKNLTLEELNKKIKEIKENYNN